jgi:bacterioferritin
MTNDKKNKAAAPTMRIDEAAVQAARNNLSDGAVTPGVHPYAEEICKLLNDALATEWVCTLRYRRHHYTAKGLASPAIADEFLTHANEEQAHADRITERIVQLGGAPDLDPDTLSKRSHAEYDASTELQAMIRANLVAERVAIEVYRQMIQLIGDKDPTTSRMLREILAQEEEHADELSDWMAKA